MPAKFRLKKYLSDSYYHIYNKGIDGKEIFLDENDYLFFISLLKRYLSKENIIVSSRNGFKQLKPSLQLKLNQMNLNEEVKLISYCLMSNHFHLLVLQRGETGITKLMRRLSTNYSMYFNKKYHRHGPLFESVYKGVLVETEEQVLHLSKFIHFNPVAKSVRRFGLMETVVGTDPGEYPYSSYKNYLRVNDDLIHKEPIIKMLGEMAYKDFISKTSQHVGIIDNLLLDI